MRFPGGAALNCWDGGVAWAASSEKADGSCVTTVNHFYNGVIRAELCDGAGRNETALAVSLPAAEFGLVPVILEAEAVVLVCLQLPVASPHFRHSPAGVPHPNAPDLVGGGLEALRDRMDDPGLDLLPVGRFPGPFQPGYGLVVAPPGGVKPQLQRPALRFRRINPNPP